MIVQNAAINFRWVIAATPGFATYSDVSYFDLQIQAPDGTVTYSEGVDAVGNWATAFTAPTATVDGSIEVNDLTLSQTGVYTLILGTGGSTNFTILDTVLALVVEQDSLVENTITLA